LSLEGGDAFGLRVAGGFSPAQQQGQLPDLVLQGRLSAITILEPRFEFALAQRQHVRADFERLSVYGICVLGGALIERGAAAAFIECLHPERFGDMGDGRGEAVERGGAAGV
jgi:hypothetical protein